MFNPCISHPINKAHSINTNNKTRYYHTFHLSNIVGFLSPLSSFLLSHCFYLMSKYHSLFWAQCAILAFHLCIAKFAFTVFACDILQTLHCCPWVFKSFLNWFWYLWSYLLLCCPCTLLSTNIFIFSIIVRSSYFSIFPSSLIFLNFTNQNIFSCSITSFKIKIF